MKGIESQIYIARVLEEAVITRRKNSRTVADALQENRWGAGHRWRHDRGEITSVHEPLATDQLSAHKPDTFRWIGSVLSGEYSTEDTYRLLCERELLLLQQIKSGNQRHR